MKTQKSKRPFLLCVVCVSLLALFSACGDDVETSLPLATSSLPESSMVQDILPDSDPQAQPDSLVQAETPIADLESLNIEQADFEGAVVSIAADSFTINPILQVEGGAFGAVAIDDDSVHLTVSFSDTTVFKVFNFHSEPSKDYFTQSDISALGENRTVSIWGQEENGTITASIIAVWLKAD